MTNEELVTEIQAGNSELITQLWDQCYGFVRQQALRWAKAWVNRADFDLDDLIQSGYIALSEAVRGFTEEKGHSFISYLAFHLKTEFARCAGCRTPAQAREPLNHAISIDMPAYSGDLENDITVGDTIPSTEQGFEDVEEAVFNQQLAGTLNKALHTLPDRLRKVMELYYLHRCTYIEIADLLSISHSRAGQLTKEGLRRLRRCPYTSTLFEMYGSSRNYFKHTSYCSWKHSGTSSPEWELLKKEKDARMEIIKHCLNMGMTMEKAQALFPL